MEPLTPGVTVDRFSLVAPLGEGGQGSVWRAEDPLRPGVPVALKLISLHLVSAADIDRFRREARVLARFSHPSLPRCHAFFEDLHRDVLGFALDLVEGSSLAALLGSDTLTPAHRGELLRHLGAALRYIHEAGLVHRDIKSQNVMIDRAFFARPEDPKTVKLVDFGIAAAPMNPAPLTAPGSVIGTVEFLAPELIDRGYWREPADGPERDVFAFGILAYELFKGRHPLGLPAGAPMGDYLIAYRTQGTSGEPWPGDVSGDPLETFYRRCLALRSSERAPHGGAALELLHEAMSAPARISVPTRAEGVPQGALEVARTELVGPISAIPHSLSPADRSRQRRTLAALLGGGVALFVASSLFTYFLPYSTQPISLPTSLPLPRIPLPSACPSGLPCPDPEDFNREGKARYFDDGLPPSPVPTALVTVRPAPAPPAQMTCPEDMALITGAQPFCIDKREVSVRDYQQCLACGAAKNVFWPGAMPAEIAEHEKNCTASRPGMEDKPVTCVKWFDANQYCTGRQRRLPRMEELRLSRNVISLCQNVDRACPLFEWSLDAAPNKTHPTRGPSFRHRDAFEGSNPESASNDDLGFRCAQDAVPASP
jgi:serine/threonine protein kinase